HQVEVLLGGPQGDLLALRLHGGSLSCLRWCLTSTVLFVSVFVMTGPPQAASGTPRRRCDRPRPGASGVGRRARTRALAILAGARRSLESTRRHGRQCRV